MRSCFSPLSNISGDKGFNGWTWIIGLRHGMTTRCSNTVIWFYVNFSCVFHYARRKHFISVIDFSVSVFNQIWTSVSMSDCRAELSFVNLWKMKNFMRWDGWMNLYKWKIIAKISFVNKKSKIFYMLQ